MVKSIDFDRLMTSEGTESYIDFGIYLENGQSVAHTRHRIFQFRFFRQVKDTLKHFIGLISESKLYEYSRYN